MSARDTIAGILFEFSGSGQGVDEMLAEIATAQADAIISGLEASGRSIVHKDEIHAPSVERAIAVAVAQADYFRKLTDNGQGTHGLPGYVRDATWHSWLGRLFEAKHIAAALRELMKGVGRG